MITPQEVKEYTSFDSVKNRDDEKIHFDIVQAKQDIFKYCGHRFTTYQQLPDEVKLALIKLTEYYALINSDEGIAKGIQSESLGNYSYSIGEKTYKMNLKSLLDDYVENTSKRGTRFRMRSL